MPFSVLYMLITTLELLAVTFRGAQGSSLGPSTETFTQNAICRHNNCINPLFPGLHDLPRLEQLVWQCSTHTEVSDYLDFCKHAVRYDPALPSPNSTSQLVSTLVRAQDDAASTMFFYHLQGMGYEAWENQQPADSNDPCVKTVWEMVCYTYFPRADAGCQAGQASVYKRPCMSSCQSYLSQCNVECCDESPQCVFQHRVEGAGGKSMLQTGYVEQMAPSALCTGPAVSGSRGLSAPLALLLGILGLHVAAAVAEDAPVQAPAISGRRQSRRNFGHYILAVALLVCAIFLQGCNMNVPEHSVGNWRAEPNYLVTFEFQAPGQSSAAAVLNSCMVENSGNVCSGRGYCKVWNRMSTAEKPLSFCSCETDWTGPECNIRRKSQIATFLYSVFLGWLGIDYFYLGYVWWAILKLLTLGGLGFWWVLDIVRTGSGPIYAAQFRVSANLPHWVYMLVVVTLFMLIGFVAAILSYFSLRRKRLTECMRLAEHEESGAHQLPKMDELDGPRFRGHAAFEGRRQFSGYGATIPMPIPNASAPYPQQGAMAAPYMSSGRM